MDQIKVRLNRVLRMTLMWDVVNAAGEAGLTMEELAERGGLTRSPYLARVVRDLLDLGCIAGHYEENHTGRAVTVFTAVKPYPPA